MRLSPVLASVLLLAFFTSPAWAVSQVTQLNADNITKQNLAFDIKAQATGENVRFTVTIDAKNAALSSILEGNLTIADGDKQIVSVAVDKTRTEKSVTYTFEVSAKLLAKSTFNFGNMSVSNGVPMPAGDFYWFYLGDFKPQK